MEDVKVVISFDAEFSINGAFSDPRVNKPSAEEIFSPNSGGSEGLLDVITILERHNVAATFFVEALNIHYFGMEKMGEYVRQLSKCKQDIQLHTHPCWLTFKDPNWQKDIQNKSIVDNFINMSLDEIVTILEQASKTLTEWTSVEPIAYRAGNLQACLPLYQALAKTKFKMSSNIGLPIFKPEESELQIENVPGSYFGVTELPVTTFKSMGKRHKALTITGNSFIETKEVLNQCKRLGIQHVVILTHVHEFVKYNKDKNLAKKNRVNLRRLEKLCNFVNETAGFSFSTFGQLASERCQYLTNSQQKTTFDVRTSLLSGVWSILQNQLNDRLWDY